MPLSTPPAWYVQTSPSMAADGTVFSAGPPIVVGMFNNRYGIYYPGDTIKVALKFGASTSTLTTYTITDYFGNVVATGTPTFDSSNTTSLGTAPNPGWYRVRFTGSQTATSWNNAYADTHFCVIRANSNFPRVPSSSYDYTHAKWMPDGLGSTNVQVAAGTGPVFNSGVDIIMRACLGIPMGRLSAIGSSNPFNPDGGTSDRLTHDNLPYCQGVLQSWYVNPTNPAWLDPVRPRPVFMEFPNGGTYDAVQLPNNFGSVVVANHTVDGSKTFVSMSTGSLSGQKIQVFNPTSANLVETFDNLSNDGSTLEATINGVSNYILVAANGGAPSGSVSPTAIGNSSRNGVMAIVSALYPLGVTHYEGPQNEPLLSKGWALAMKVFADAVHDAAPGAKTIGPCTVTITNTLDNWRLFLGGGVGYAGGLYCDEFSFHDYNTAVDGDLNQGRANIETFLSMLNEFGLRNKPLWQTEATGGNSGVIQSGIYFPRRGSAIVNKTLLWEQYGVPREKNPYWYDLAHGFWGDPCFLVNGDWSLNPQAVLYCTLAQETFGMNHHHRIDFGSVPANNLFLGSVYGNPTVGSVAVMTCMSAMPSSTVTLTVNGTTSALTVIDAFGNSSTVTPSSGRVTVNVLEVPTYLRLPAGVTVSVYSIRDWAHGPSPSISATRVSNIIGGQARPEVADDRFFNYYGGGLNNTGIAFSNIDLPDTCEIKFAGTVSVERILVYCGPSYQAMSAIFTYTVDTWDGTSWTTTDTITKSPPPSIYFGSSGTTVASSYEQYWDEQWVDDIKLTGSPVSCKGVRISVTATSYGGVVDSAAATGAGNAGGASVADPRLVIQEITVISPTTVSLGSAYDTVIEADSPVGYWKLNEAAGATTAVSQVNAPGVNGAASNVVFGKPSLIQGTATAALFPNSAPGQQITVTDSSTLHLGDTFTLECWFETDSVIGGAANKTILYKTLAYALLTNGTTITFALNSTTNITICSATAPVITGTVYHIAVTKTGSTVKMYMNGQDVTGTVTNQTIPNGGNLNFGFSGGNSGMTLQNIAVYPSALSASKVAAHYAAGIQPQAPSNLFAPRIEGG